MQTGNDILREKIDEWFANRESELLRELSALIDINSVNGAPKTGAPYGMGARRALEYSRGILERFGFDSEVFEDCVAVCTVGGQGGETALDILVHVDVVDADPSEWASDPFSAEIRDSNDYGKTQPVLFGRGAVDDKGPAVASMFALACANELSGGLPRGARLLVGSAEEIGCVDIARWLEKNTPSPTAFSPDADFPVVNTEKGRMTAHFGKKWESESALPRIKTIRGGSTLNIIPGAASAVVAGLTKHEIEKTAAKTAVMTGAEFRVTDTADNECNILATGTAAHASADGGFCNAQTALLELLRALPLAPCGSTDAICGLSELFPHGDTGGKALGIDCRDDISGSLTLAFTVLELDDAGFSAKLDSRTPCVADEMDILGKSRAKIEGKGFEIRDIAFTRSHHTPVDSELVETLVEIYRDYTGDNDSAPSAIGGHTYVHDIPGGVAFGPELSGVDNRIHGRDEFIGVEHLMLAAKMYATAIIRLAG